MKLSTSADDAIFDANSPNCSVNITSRVCKTLNFTGYTNIIAMTNYIGVSGSVTLGASMVISGSQMLLLNSTGTLTSNGKTWPNNIQAQPGATLTLADNWTVGGTVLYAGAVFNGSNLYVNGGLSVLNAPSSGTTNFHLTGTGTWSNSNGAFANNLTINTSGTITISGTVYFRYKTLTYTAGTVTTTNSTIIFDDSNTTCTINTNGISWNNVTIRNSSTKTLSSNMDVNGTLSLGESSYTTTINGSTINAGGSLTISGTVTGTTNIVLDGTGTWFWKRNFKK